MSNVATEEEINAGIKTQVDQNPISIMSWLLSPERRRKAEVVGWVSGLARGANETAHVTAPAQAGSAGLSVGTALPPLSL